MQQLTVFHKKIFFLDSKVLCLFVILFFTSLGLLSQEYKMLSYTKKQGLHSNLTKAIIQDSIGFIWIATDNGLERFNGKKFEHFTNGLPSVYIKSFFMTDSGELIVVTDMGVVKILNKPDKPEFETLVQGSSSYTDSMLFYPKMVYQDNNKALWISDNNSVWRFKNDTLKKYTFSEKEYTLNFQRSFTILENSLGDLYVFSQTGYAFKYNGKKDIFEPQEQIPKFSSVDGAYFIDDDRMLVASYDGLFLLNINSDKPVKAEQIISTDACRIIPFNDSVFLVGSWTEGVFKCQVINNQFKVEKIRNIQGVKINNLFVDKMENLWLASDFGVVLAQNLVFNSLSQMLEMSFVHSVNIAPDNKVHCIAGSAYSFVRKKGKLEKQFLYSLPFGGILVQIAASKIDTSLIYLGTTDAKLLELKNGVLNRQISLSEFGRVLFFLETDLKGNVWACLDGCSGVVKISPELKPELIDKRQGLDSRAIVVRTDSSGNLYCGGFGDTTYLFKFDYSLGKFMNVSTMLPDKHSKDLVINDIAFRNNVVFMAASEGVIVQKGDSIDFLDLGVFSNKSVNSIAVDRKGFVWFSNDVGLFKYKNGKHYIFRENDGLNNIVGSYRCLAIDTLNQVWFGTQTGLNFSEGIKEIHKTKQPILTGVFIDGRPVSCQKQHLEIKKHSYIQFEYISLEMPGTDIIYKTKLEGYSIEWSPEVNDNELLIPSLPVGEYTLNIKARQHGNYNWSDAQKFSFSVVPNWYQTWWAFLLFVTALVLLIGVANILYNRRLIEQKKILEHKVKIRTKEIAKKTKELEYLNNTKDKFFSIIAHDLRNPFGSIMGLTKILSSEFDNLDEDRKRHLIKIINTSTEKTYTLLENLLTWARTQTNTINFEPEVYNLSELIKEAVGITEVAIHAKNMLIVYNINHNFDIKVDKNMITTVVRNLIMNAIKYSYRDKSITVQVDKVGTQAKVSIIDEGVGIKPQRINELFDINEKVSEPGTENEKGTGLGLVLCKEFVQKHNGSIGVDSDLGKGSTFWFTMPISIDLKNE